MLPLWRLSGEWWFGPRGLCLNTIVVALDKFATYELHWIAYCYTIDMRSVKCLMSWHCQLLHEKAFNTSQIHLANLFEKNNILWLICQNSSSRENNFIGVVIWRTVWRYGQWHFGEWAKWPLTPYLTAEVKLPVFGPEKVSSPPNLI